MNTLANPVKLRTRAFAILVIFALLAWAMPAAGEVAHLKEGGMAYIEEAIRAGEGRINFEVAENGFKFGFDQGQPLDENGFPLYGNNFITQGYIYPKGTLKRDRDTGLYNGVNPDGSAEFPDKVLGIWICRGWVLGDEGYNIETGPVVATTQIYDFHEIAGQFGKITLVSDGTELIDENVPILRAVTGGTGPYKRAKGQVRQVLLGLNGTVGVTLKYQLQVK